MRIEDLAILLGDEPSTIMAHYLHPTPRMLRDRVDRAWGWRNPVEAAKDPIKADAKKALVSLGYTAKEAHDMAEKVVILPDMEAAHVVQQALRAAN